ncbi:hypothetical protein OsJ_26268 [Oryza sativa Japonica Group]|uniref:Uncharacterized protein n=1 Tax=Oryza sativa subsp. japonica TaxID=39947 RepID=A3BQ91_ORYSJ|nr:hypothetical protein OsJ_26268 [Oryza sativa Japonica Group]
MADAVLADGRATGYTRELAAPSADWFLRMSHAGGGLGGGNDFTGNAVALYSSVGDYAGDQRTVLVDMDRVGELVHGEARNTGAPYTGAGGFARGPPTAVASRARTDTVRQRHSWTRTAPARLPLGGVADFVERDMAAPHTVAGGVPFDKAQSVGTAAGAAPSSPNAAQVTIDVDFVAEAIEAKRAVGGRGSNLASAVVGIVTASSAVTMVAAGDVSPPVAFGLFVLMIAGLSLAVSGVRRV